MIIDQTKLPHEFSMVKLRTLDAAANAIKTMQVRGAPLIGAAAAYGMALAMSQDATNDTLDKAYQLLLQTRPTAINLRWALDRMYHALRHLTIEKRASAAWSEAAAICDEDVIMNQAIGNHGLKLLEQLYDSKRDTLNVSTHCNAGWLATVDWGTALSPIYMAHDCGIPIHVWVDETRPRNQGASLTAWELQQHGVPHTIVVDSSSGHLMQHGLVNLVIVGTDRTTAIGDVCNKIGTYMKALAAHDNNIPFYVALPGPSIDWSIKDGLAEIPIEQRDDTEVKQVTGRSLSGEMLSVSITPEHSPILNYGFDVTPAHLITAFITERGLVAPNALRTLYPEHQS